MRWVIQENLYNEEGFNTLKRVLEVMELPHSVHKVVPFSHELIPDIETLEKGERVIVMGAYTMAGIAEARGWKPGAYTGPGFEFAYQKEAWGRLMLNHDAWTGPLRDVPEQPKPVNVSLSGISWCIPKPFFIRPTTDSKFFAGTVMDWDEFTTFRNNILALGWEGTITGDTDVMVCSAKEIWREYRTWIVRGKVVTASLYKEGARVRYSDLVDPAIKDFAEAAAAIWSPTSAYVLDVADTPEGLRIVEINCLNAAGFYKGDVGLIVQALEDLDADLDYLPSGLQD